MKVHTDDTWLHSWGSLRAFTRKLETDVVAVLLADGRWHRVNGLTTITDESARVVEFEFTEAATGHVVSGPASTVLAVREGMPDRCA